MYLKFKFKVQGQIKFNSSRLNLKFKFRIFIENLNTKMKFEQLKSRRVQLSLITRTVCENSFSMIENLKKFKIKIQNFNSKFKLKTYIQNSSSKFKSQFFIQNLNSKIKFEICI